MLPFVWMRITPERRVTFHFRGTAPPMRRVETDVWMGREIGSIWVGNMRVFPRVFPAF